MGKIEFLISCLEKIVSKFTTVDNVYGTLMPHVKFSENPFTGDFSENG